VLGVNFTTMALNSEARACGGFHPPYDGSRRLKSANIDGSADSVALMTQLVRPRVPRMMPWADLFSATLGQLGARPAHARNQYSVCASGRYGVSIWDALKGRDKSGKPVVVHIQFAPLLALPGCDDHGCPPRNRSIHFAGQGLTIFPKIFFRSIARVVDGSGMTQTPVAPRVSGIRFHNENRGAVVWRSPSNQRRKLIQAAILVF
jgi:hypothetical protein